MLKEKQTYVVAVVGAAGTVGGEMVEILGERTFPVADLVLLDAEQSEGERIGFQEKNVIVRLLHKDSFNGVDIALFSAGTELSLEFARSAVASGTVVIDNSGAFRMDPEIPLVVPEVNASALRNHTGIIATPTSSAVGMVSALKPIHDKVRIKRAVVTTFQPVSDTGKDAMDELAQQTVALLNFRDIEASVYPHQIAFNCFPHVGSFLDNGYTGEEATMVDETRKIMNDNSIQITATAVQVPVFRGLSLSVNIELENKITANEIRAILASSPGVTVYDDPKKNIYPLAIDVIGKNETYVGRIREDESNPHGFNLWIAIDNIRKGAALNAVQIAELLIQ